MVRILIVDDFEHIRCMIRALLQSDHSWQVCGEGADGQEAIDQCASLRPNLIILNLHMPVLNGLEAARHVLVRFPETLILIMTIDVSACFAAAAMECGAQGLIRKGSMSEDLPTAIAALVRGERYHLEEPPLTSEITLAKAHSIDATTLHKLVS